MEGCEGPDEIGSDESGTNAVVFGHIEGIIKMDEIAVLEIPVGIDCGYQQN